MTDVLLAQRRPPAAFPAPPRPAPRGTRFWASVICSIALLGAAVGFLLSDATAANHRYDRAHRALTATHATTGVVSYELATARVDLRLLTQQVGSDTTALAQDTSQLQGARSALSAAEAHVFEQGALLNSLHSCLDGVEQALNALATNHQTQAASALHAVSSSCSAAVNESG